MHFFFSKRIVYFFKMVVMKKRLRDLWNICNYLSLFKQDFLNSCFNSLGFLTRRGACQLLVAINEIDGDNLITAMCFSHSVHKTKGNNKNTK